MFYIMKGTHYQESPLEVPYIPSYSKIVFLNEKVLQKSTYTIIVSQ